MKQWNQPALQTLALQSTYEENFMTNMIHWCSKGCGKNFDTILGVTLHEICCKGGNDSGVAGFPENTEGGGDSSDFIS